MFFLVSVIFPQLRRSTVSWHSKSRRKIEDFGPDQNHRLSEPVFFCKHKLQLMLPMVIGFPFRTVPQRRKLLVILYHGTKLEANARNSVLSHSSEEKTTLNSIPWNKNISKYLESCSKPFHGRDNNSEFRLKQVSDENMQSIVCWSRISCKTNFFKPFLSVPNFGIDSSVNFGMPRNEHFLLRNNGSHQVYSAEVFRNKIPTPALEVKIPVL